MRQTIPMLAMAMISAGLLAGCGGGAGSPQPAAHGKPHADHPGHKHGDEHDHGATTKKAAHDHSGWWFNEHGVPEEVCALCDSKVAADFHKKGDWCKMHERPDSQCFACHPELEAKFAALYEAKYGEKPPKPEVN